MQKGERFQTRLAHRSDLLFVHPETDPRHLAE